MDSTANHTIELVTYYLSHWPGLVRRQVSAMPVTITLSLLAAAYIVLNPEYARPTHRHARTRIFIALGLCSILPISHMVLSHGIYAVFQEMGFLWLLAAGVMYITGAVL